MLKFALMLVGFFASVYALGSGLGGPDQGKDSQMDEEDIYNCYHYLNCEGGDATFKEACDKAYDCVTEDDIKDPVLKWLEKIDITHLKPDPTEIRDYFCCIDDDAKVAAYEHCKKEFIDFFASCNKDPKKSEQTKRINCYIDGLGSLMDKHKKAKNCGKDIPPKYTCTKQKK